jgi:FAD/FMN-containing dehydrogenase
MTDEDVKKTMAYMKGFINARKDIDRSKNPYHPDTFDYNNWDNGWLDGYDYYRQNPHLMMKD